MLFFVELGEESTPSSQTEPDLVLMRLENLISLQEMTNKALRSVPVVLHVSLQSIPKFLIDSTCQR